MIRCVSLLVLLMLFVGCEKDPEIPTSILPDIRSTIAATNITSTSAKSGGNLIAAGSGPILAKGICWSTSTNPTINGNKTTEQGGLGLYESTMTGLTTGVTYYVRAYATNRVGTSYGNELSFKTLALASLTTTTASSIIATSAVTGGNISNNGGSAVTARGVCWNTSPAPTIALLTKTSNGSGNGSFSSSITNLVAGTTYYVRAYATNSVGTSYGNEITFTTLSPPVVTTNSISNITTNSAIVGGNVTSMGGASVTARGVCWSTSPNPTISLPTRTLNGSGTGSFSSTITGLSSRVTYYVRAYATNSVGTSYGLNVSFRTN